MKPIDNLLIISIYDSSYNFGVLNNNKHNENEENELRKQHSLLGFSEFYDYLKNKYPNHTIYICEDGNITLIIPTRKKP